MIKTINYKDLKFDLIKNPIGDSMNMYVAQGSFPEKQKINELLLDFRPRCNRRTSNQFNKIMFVKNSWK